MTQLEDRRPVAATTAASDHPNVIGEDLAQLLLEHPDLELASIRFIPKDDGTVGIAGRIGQLAGVECPQCHQPASRPHTDYCTLAPEQVWDRVLPSACDKRHPGTGLPCRVTVPGHREHSYERPASACAHPAANRGDGRGCGYDDCPRHGGQ